jgi:hypothetical protein
MNKPNRAGPAGDATKQAKAAQAGDRGKSTQPMGNGMRINAYWGQNEETGRATLTARQHRQIDRMERHNLRKAEA